MEKNSPQLLKACPQCHVGNVVEAEEFYDFESKEVFLLSFTCYYCENRFVEIVSSGILDALMAEAEESSPVGTVAVIILP